MIADASPEPETFALPTRHIGRRVLLFERLASTNSFALDLGADPANDGVVVLAREQSAGRGQYGRTWQAAPGSSVLLSALLFPPPSICRPAVLTAWAALSVVELIRDLTGHEASIKWPNDIYLNGKKVCGILIEQRSCGAAVATVAGIGLNVRQAAEFFERAALPLGGSLLSETGHEADPDEVARRLIHGLDAEYARLRDGAWSTLESRWQARLGLLGREVRLETTGAPLQGRLLEVSFEGVVVDTGDAAPSCLVPEMVRQIVALDRPS